MKPEEMKSFIKQNHDLLETYDDVDWQFIDIDNIPELLTRFLESKEFKAYSERKWKSTERLSGGTTVIEIPSYISEYRTFNND